MWVDVLGEGDSWGGKNQPSFTIKTFRGPKEACSESITFSHSLASKEHNQNTVPVAAPLWKERRLEFAFRTCFAIWISGMQKKQQCLLSKDALLKLDSSLAVYCVPPSFLSLWHRGVRWVMLSQWEKNRSPNAFHYAKSLCHQLWRQGVWSPSIRGEESELLTPSPGLFAVLKATSRD